MNYKKLKTVLVDTKVGLNARQFLAVTVSNKPV